MWRPYPSRSKHRRRCDLSIVNGRRGHTAPQWRSILLALAEHFVAVHRDAHRGTAQISYPFLSQQLCSGSLCFRGETRAALRYSSRCVIASGCSAETSLVSPKSASRSYSSGLPSGSGRTAFHLPISNACNANSLDTKLQLLGAAPVQPLKREQVHGFLKQAGEAVEGVRAALQGDSTLSAVLDTPLMLNIAMLAYQGASAGTVQLGRTLEERRAMLFGKCIDAAFQRRIKTEPYDRDKTIHWGGVACRSARAARADYISPGKRARELVGAAIIPRRRAGRRAARRVGSRAGLRAARFRRSQTYRHHAHLLGGDAEHAGRRASLLSWLTLYNKLLCSGVPCRE